MYVKYAVKRFFAVMLASMVFMGVANAAKPNDADALKGVSEGRVVWDITKGDPKSLLLFLKVIEETYDDLKRQNVTPDMVFTFHGPVVKLISTAPQNLPLDDEEALEEIVALLQRMNQRPGVRMESCSVATRLFGIDNKTILKGIKPVGNTFVSLIGYQKQGYALIPIY
ncbi:MAG: hypothetical protein DWQ09_05245 [Proteobacteria bacterium]|nr:MAG: hypothetical protein DWQ09_05245 [Pseudomonadota bacterium]QKK11360.1 MAG: DsrE family protein [Pseudomonadota bacterium]